MTAPAPAANVPPTLGTGPIPCPNPRCSNQRRDMLLTTGARLAEREDKLAVEELRCRACGQVFDHVDSTGVTRTPGEVTTIGGRRLEGAPEQYRDGWPRG